MRSNWAVFAFGTVFWFLVFMAINAYENVFIRDFWDGVLGVFGLLAFAAVLGAIPPVGWWLKDRGK